MREVPLPTMSDGLGKPVNTEFAVRETKTKVIKVGGEEIELRVLSPEEKAARRLKRNFIMVTIMALVFAVSLWIMLRM